MLKTKRVVAFPSGLRQRFTLSTVVFQLLRNDLRKKDLCHVQCLSPSPATQYQQTII